MLCMTRNEVFLLPVPKQNPRQPSTSGHTQKISWHHRLVWQRFSTDTTENKTEKSTASAGAVLHTTWHNNLPQRAVYPEEILIHVPKQNPLILFPKVNLGLLLNKEIHFPHKTCRERVKEALLCGMHHSPGAQPKLCQTETLMTYFSCQQSSEVTEGGADHPSCAFLNRGQSGSCTPLIGQLLRAATPSSSCIFG